MEMLNTIKERVGNALSLDTTQSFSAAYGEYLECISMISNYLRDSTAYGQSTNEVEKLFSLCRHCMERAEEIYSRHKHNANFAQSISRDSNLPNNSTVFTSSSIQSNTSTILSPAPSRAMPNFTAMSVPLSTSPSLLSSTQTSSLNSTSQNRTISPPIRTNNSPSLFSPNSINATTQFTLTSVSPPKKDSPSLRQSTEKLSPHSKLNEEQLMQPFRDAQREDEALLSLYQNRLQRIKAEASNATQQQRLISELNLYYIRQRTENYAIAREKHQQLLKQQQETRNKKIEATRSSQSTTSNILQKANSLVQTAELKIADKQFQYELSKSPDNEELVKSHFNNILNNPNHPCGRMIVEFVSNWRHKSLQSDVNSLEVLKEEVQRFIDQSTNNIHASFKGLTTRTQHIAPSLIEVILFKNIFRDLFELYKDKHHKKDTLLATKSQLFKTITPLQLGIQRDLWLQDDERFPQEPYLKAICAARTISNYNTPEQKLNCLLEVSNTICACVDDYYKLSDTKRIIGADQLLPLLSYVVIKANIAYAYSECSFLADFISEKAMGGEHGYMLASFQTCLEYISSLDLDTLSGNQKKEENANGTADKSHSRNSSANNITVQNEFIPNDITPPHNLSSSSNNLSTSSNNLNTSSNSLSTSSNTLTISPNTLPTESSATTQFQTITTVNGEPPSNSTETADTTITQSSTCAEQLTNENVDTVDDNMDSLIETDIVVEEEEEAQLTAELEEFLNK